MYYPVVVFGGNPMDPRDSNIGFPWGENALAFKVTFDTDILKGTEWAFGLSTSIEYVLNGSKSPDNPWHQYQYDSQIPNGSSSSTWAARSSSTTSSSSTRV